MNGMLITALLRQRLTSPLRLLFLAASTFMPLLFIAAAPAVGFAPLENSFNLALVFGAGMIGQDVSSGVVQLILARPVSRAEYALSRWFAASLGAALVAVAQIGLASLILAARGASPGFPAIAMLWGNHLTSAFGATAPLLLMSALAPGLGDVGLVLLCYVTGGLVSAVGGAMNVSWLGMTGQLTQDFINPMVEFGKVVGPATSWYELISYASTVTLCLALAIVVLNRKELSYAAG